MMGMVSMTVDEATVDAVLTASRTLVGVATRSMGAAAEETTISQYRRWWCWPHAGRGAVMVDLARSLEVTPSTAGRMCDRLLRKGLIRRTRARADRREVQVSLTAAGRAVVDEATARRRALLAGILSRLSAREQLAVASAFRAFASAAGEVPDSEWPDQPEPEEAGRGGASPAVGKTRSQS